jgi:hypothetical protein
LFVSKYPPIKLFLLRFILILSVTILFDFGIGTILKFCYFHQKSGATYRTTYAFDSTKAEVLVFGSSRASHHYVPEIFEASLHCTFYNTGSDGNFILYNSAIFKGITKRYKPRMIIFDIIPDELEYSADSYDRLSSLLPYYYNHPEIRRIVNLRSRYEKIKLLSSIYPYNSLLVTIAIGQLEFNKKRKPDNKGYIPLCYKMKNVKLDTRQNEIIKHDFCIDYNKVDALKEIISICKLKNIRLIFVKSPLFNFVHNSCYDLTFSKLCSETDISYFNFSNEKEFLNQPAYFADRSHLNEDGAKEFSKLLVAKIQHSN